MLRPDRGVPELSSERTLIRIAAIGALVAGLGLAGCGRKGGLDPPPGASIVDPADVPQPNAGPVVGPDGKAVAPAQAPRRWTPLDWLLN
jgi:predicted small lipoprotein YifL